MDLLLFFLGYPLSVFANISTEYLQNIYQGCKIEPLKKIFVKALIDSLDIRYKQVDSYGKKVIKQIKESLKSDNEKIIMVLKKFSSNNYITITDFRRDEFIASLSNEIVKEFSLSEKFDTKLVLSIIKDCLYYYQVSFFKKMSNKDADIALIKILEKIESNISTKRDIAKLRAFIYEQLMNLKPELEKILKDAINNNIIDLIKNEASNPESEEFSYPIKIQMNKLKKKIEKLTNEQLKIIQFLKYHKRVIISGCAGSGKTLVAAEKAIRLDKAGIKTLILCHNPYLAEYIKTLITGTGVEVFDFTNWVFYLNSNFASYYNDWSEYVEPIESEINAAFDILSKGTINYDAIIVDEGQDFRELWWLLVESALSESKILYIFHDDNQSLLPFRANYPIKQSPFSMSRNCRNAGKIFEIVRKFHYQAPEISLHLKDKGVFKISVFQNNYEKTLAKAISDAYKYAPDTQIVVLTTEPYLINKSILKNFEFIKDDSLSWFNVVENDLFYIKNEFERRLQTVKNSQKIIHSLESDNKNESDISIHRRMIEATEIRDDIILNNYWNFDVPTINGATYPSKTDIKNVTIFTNNILNAFTFGTNELDKNVKWYVNNDQLSVVFRPGDDTFNPYYESASFKQKLMFFSSNEWYKNIPEILTVKLSSNNMSAIYKHDEIPLFTTSSFKGLEADAIILFVDSPSFGVLSRLYVGVSRAFVYLHLVIDRMTLAHLSILIEEVNKNTM